MTRFAFLPDTPARPGFIKLDNRIMTHYASRVGAHAVAVYLVLALHADAKTRQCYPSIRTISRLSKLSRPTVLKAIAKLEEERLIKVERGRSARGDREVNRYTLLPIRGGQTVLPPVVNDVDHRGQAALPEQDLINKTQKNKEARVRAARAPAQRIDEPARDPTLDHDAVRAYRDVCRFTPNPTQRAAIVATVDDSAKWQEVMRSWLMAGYSPKNVAGMLDWYRNGIPQRRNGSGRAGSSSERNGSSGQAGERTGGALAETPDEAARRDAEWQQLVAGTIGRDLAA